MKHFKSKLRASVAVFLATLMIITCVPMAAAVGEKQAQSLYDLGELKNTYLNPSEDEIKEYPNGAFMFPLARAETKMNNFYAYEVFRQGGTQGEATVTVRATDYTAGYGEDYNIYLDSATNSSAVEGKANRYYDLEEYSFLPVVTKTQTSFDDNSGTSEELAERRQAYSDYMDSVNEIMPVSASFDLTFADGENSKTIYIETLQKQQVTANLEFTLTLSNEQNASLGAQATAAFTIVEEREKPTTTLEIKGSMANASSDEAYVTVERSGNMGTYGSYRVTTRSDSAQAGTDYDAVQMQLDFFPGMKTQQIPIKLLDSAANGKSFYVELDNVSNATALNEKARVSVTQLAVEESAHMSAVSPEVSSAKAERGTEIINANDFSLATHTNRGTGTQEWGYNKKAGYTELFFKNKAAAKNNGVSVKSNYKINFSGVDYLSMVIDNYTGSCDWDHNAIYVSDNDKFKSDTSDYDWLDNLGGVGGSWDMTNVSDGHIVRKTATLDQSKVSGEHYLYIMLHKSGFGGTAQFKIFNSSDTAADNVLLHLTHYNMQILNPNSVKILEGGKLVDKAPAKNVELIDPTSTSDSNRTTSTKIDIYRNETTGIVGAIDSSFGSGARLKGFVFHNTATGKESELIELASDTFTLKPQWLAQYKDYINGTNIAIKPVYTIDKAQVAVTGYNNTTTNGQKLELAQDGKSASFYYNNALQGTLSWSVRDDGSFLIGDSVKFTFEPTEAAKTANWQVKYDVSKGANADDAATRDYQTLTSPIQITDLYTAIKPVFYVAETNTQLYIKNVGDGVFSGKDGNKYVKNPDGSGVVTGYTKQDGGSDVDFKSYAPGQVITFEASPNSGYRAKWTYTNDASAETKTYYGESFFYTVQSARTANTNRVTLEFEKIADASTRKTVYLNGKTMLQQGTIINPPNNETDTYNLVGMASVIMGKYSGISDENGEFYLETDATMEGSEKAQITCSQDEIQRAMVVYNNQYFICDVNMADYITDSINNNDDVAVDLKMPYRTVGARPISITATSSSTNDVYGGTIPLVAANAVKFDLALDLAQQDQAKPVNMVRFTVEGDQYLSDPFDVDLQKGESVAHWAQQISEVIKAGQKLYVELFNKSYDSDANPVYTSNGKFDTGYEFIAMAVEDTVTYAPDIGVSTTMAMPVPAIGPVSPTFSLKGFTPIIDVGTTGTDNQGHTMKTITIGFSFGKLSNVAAEDKSWKSASPLDKGKALGNILSNYDKCYNDTGSLPKNSVGGKLSKALNMQTAVKLSFSLALCYQGNYYIDDDSGEWMFTSNYVIIGIGGSIRVSVPFVFFYIPCFTYITVNANANVYLSFIPNADAETGSSVALTLNQLDDAGLSHTQGIYEFILGIEFGLGIGYDGLVSASGNLKNIFDIQFNDFMRGVGNYSLKGGVAVELLFLKASWSGNIARAQLFNTLDDATAYNDQLLSEFGTDILKTTRLKDLTVSIADTETQQDTQTQSFTAVLNSEEKILADTSSVVTPSIQSLGGGKYFIACIMDGNVNGQVVHNMLNYMIYDSNTDEVIECNSVLQKVIDDLKSSEARAANNTQISELSKQLDKIDYDVSMADCGDDILLTWNKAVTQDQTTNSTELIKSVCVASIYYNKSTGTFHNYQLIGSNDSSTINVCPKPVYNAETKLAQVFYQQLDVSSLSEESTLEDFQNTPSTLYARSVVNSDNNSAWGEPQAVTANHQFIKYYDVSTIGNKNILSFVGSNQGGFTVENTEDYEFLSDTDTTGFNTENSMYVQTFEPQGEKVVVGSQAEITGQDYVTANPQFVHINADGVDNLLLFYKCNGLYAYQNIDTIYSQGLYTDQNGKLKITEDYMEPTFITTDEDNTVNDDFDVVYNENGEIYAMWTTTEGTQQQVWARSFVIDGVDTVEGSIVYDENGNVMYDENGNHLVDKYDKPLQLLKGYWGGKTYLTEGGVNGGTQGMFKKSFANAVLGDQSILSVYNAFDQDYTDGNVNTINNKLVIGEYSAKPHYVIPEDYQIEFSNEYPSAGETVTVTAKANNTGVLYGKNVDVTLYVNGEAYSTQTFDKWITGDYKTVTFDYTLPQGVKADDVSMYYTVSENGEEKVKSNSQSLKYGESLKITDVKINPIKNITDSNKNAKFNVSATVKNVGNTDYNGGNSIMLVEKDNTAVAAAMAENGDKDAVAYTALGKTEVGEIKQGHSRKVVFNSDDIPEDIFSKQAGGTTAYLESILTTTNASDWDTKSVSDEVTIISEYYDGLTKKPVPKTAKSIELESLELTLGQTEKLTKTVSPVSALINNNVEYVSSNPAVATVDSMGVVTAITTGTTEITATINGKTDTATVTVTKDGVIYGDVNGDGKVNMRDAYTAQKYLAEDITLDEQALKAFDVNGDGKVTLVDITLIQKYVAQEITVFPAEQ